MRISSCPKLQSAVRNCGAHRTHGGTRIPPLLCIAQKFDENHRLADIFFFRVVIASGCLNKEPSAGRSEKEQECRNLIAAHGDRTHPTDHARHARAAADAGGCGAWLDARFIDAMLYALVLAHVMRDLGMTKSTAGLLNSLTLLASGIGGVLFGFIADRVGRKRALMASILTYSVCSFASGLSTSVLMLATFRFILGLGIGGEWNTGATLVAETWPTELRAKAIAVVQSSWAIGYALAALVAGIVLHYATWRTVFLWALRRQ